MTEDDKSFNVFYIPKDKDYSRATYNLPHFIYKKVTKKKFNSKYSSFETICLYS